MKIRIALSLAALFLAGAATAETAQEATDVHCQLGGSAVAGMVMHLDPRTGRPTSRPLPDQAAEIARFQAAHSNRSTVGLVQERGPRGGIMVNLRGRFRSPLVAVRNTDGSLEVDHLSCQPANAADKAADGEDRS